MHVGDLRWQFQCGIHCGLVGHIVVDLFSGLMNRCCYIKVCFCVSKETKEQSQPHRQFSVLNEISSLIQSFKMHDTSGCFQTCLFFSTHNLKALVQKYCN